MLLVNSLYLPMHPVSVTSHKSNYLFSSDFIYLIYNYLHIDKCISSEFKEEKDMSLSSKDSVIMNEALMHFLP